MSKELLIETGFITDLKVSNELKESIAVSDGKGDTLVVRNVPCTILNRKNQNGRVYSTKELQKAITEANEKIRTKQLLCQANEHPEGSFVAPTHASHVVTKAYIKPNVEVIVEGKKGRFDMLFMDWEVLDTDEGRNLKALIKAECSLGTSIRGLGDMNGDQVVDYELLGVDVVSNPSSGTFTRMPVKESVIVEHKKSLDEAFTVEAETIDTVPNVEKASELLSALDSPEAIGSMSKAGVKFDTELDPDSGAETTVTILTTNTSDDVTDLSQALELAGKKMASNIGTTDSVTILRVDDEDLTKESVVMNEEENPDVTVAIDKLKSIAQELGTKSIDMRELQDIVKKLQGNEKTEETEYDRVDDTTISMTTDDGTEYTQEYDNKKDADFAQETLAKDDGEIVVKEDAPASDDMVYGYVLKVAAGDYKDWYVKSKSTPLELDPQLNQALLFKTQGEAEEFQMNNNAYQYDYNDGLKSEILIKPIQVTESVVKDEKLYHTADEPSDTEELNQPKELHEAEKEFKVIAKNLDFDISEDELNNMDSEDLDQILSNYPNKVTVTIKMPEELSNDHDYLVMRLNQESGLPIKDADFELVKEVKASTVEDPEAPIKDEAMDPEWEANLPGEEHEELDAATTEVNLLDPESRQKYLDEFQAAGLKVIPLGNTMYRIIGDAEKINIINEMFNNDIHDEFKSRNYESIEEDANQKDYSKLYVATGTDRNDPDALFFRYNYNTNCIECVNVNPDIDRLEVIDEVGLDLGDWNEDPQYHVDAYYRNLMDQLTNIM